MLYLFFVGCCIGSFVQVISVRFPLKQNYISGHSKCPHCHHVLHWFDLFPLISYILLKGKCRYCSHPISIRYFIVELTSGFFVALFYGLYGFTLNTLLIIILFEILLCISLIDIDHLIIYDVFLLGLCGLSICSLFLHTDIQLSHRFLGFFMMLIPLSILYKINPNGLGYGDIKLLAILGFFFGFSSIMMGFFIAVFTCLFYALFMIYLKHISKNTHIGFVPFISFGVLASYITYPLWQPYLPIYFELFTIL